MTVKDRADKILVQLGFVESRSQAAQLLKEKVVFQAGVCIDRPSSLISDQDIEIRKDHLYVGRGAHKIESATKAFELQFKNKVIVDVGASTGGFTEYALLAGASKVFALDVGHDQLAPKLRCDHRVVNLEGHNIRDGHDLGELVDMAVVDLSFISLKLVLSHIFKLVRPEGEVVCLVKPQFEAGREALGKRAVITDPKVHQAILTDLASWCEEQGYFISQACRCELKGKMGNQEYFFYFNGKQKNSLNEFNFLFEGLSS